MRTTGWNTKRDMWKFHIRIKHGWQMYHDIYGDTQIGFYHMQNFMDKYLSGDIEKECRDFLSKFDIFTEIWASTKGDDIWANCR